VKQLNFHRENGCSILVAISTEGYIAIYDVEELLGSLSSLEGKIMDLEGEFDSIYRFDIDSRLIALASRLNFVKVDSVSQPTMKRTSVKSKVTAKLDDEDEQE